MTGLLQREKDATRHRVAAKDLMQFRDVADATRLNELTNLNVTPTSLK
jgi:hypothetical protein